MACLSFPSPSPIHVVTSFVLPFLPSPLLGRVSFLFLGGNYVEAQSYFFWWGRAAVLIPSRAIYIHGRRSRERPLDIFLRLRGEMTCLTERGREKKERKAFFEIKAMRTKKREEGCCGKFRKSAYILKKGGKSLHAHLLLEFTLVVYSRHILKTFFPLDPAGQVIHTAMKNANKPLERKSPPSFLCPK